MYVQSVTTGKIYNLLPSVAEARVKSGLYVRVDESRVARIQASTIRHSS